MSTSLPLRVPRNADLFFSMTMRDYETREPVDLSGSIIESDITDIPGGAVIATASVVITNAASGEFSYLLRGEDFASFGDTQAVSRAFYDLRITHPDGVRELLSSGVVNIIPRSTQP